MALTCKSVTLASYPYMKLLNKKSRNYSFEYVSAYTHPQETYLGNNDPHSGTMYHMRKHGRNNSLPGYQCVCLPFQAVHLVPNDIFRCTDCEEIGPGAGKCLAYKNPEYYCFHHMTYYDTHLILRLFRNQCIPSGRKARRLY